MERVPGEIIALAQLQDEADELRLVVIASTKNGPAVGVLAGPPNGTEGAIGFVPVPDLYEVAAGVPELEVVLNASAGVEPTTDPNDPRGLRASRGPGRRPGMTS